MSIGALKTDADVLIVWDNPDDAGQVLQLTGAGAGTFADRTAATFAECAESYTADAAGYVHPALPAPLSASRTQSLTVYPDTATAFSDAALEQLDYEPDAAARVMAGLSSGGSLTDKSGFSLSAAAQQAVARLLRPHASVLHVRKDGNDSNDGLSPATAKLTVAAAVSAAADGDLILVGPGTFAEGDAVLDLTGDLGTLGVSLVGSGLDVTTITSTADYSVSGPIVKPGNQSLIADLTITDAGSNGAALGAVAASTAFTNAVIRSVRAYGIADGLLFSGVTCSASVYGSRISSAVDAVRINHTDGRLDLYDCDIESLPTFTAVVSGLSTVGASNVINATRCRIRARRTNNSTNARPAVDCAGGTITLFECAIRSWTTGTGTSADVDINNSGGTVIVHNCVYDRSKTVGTITERPVPRVALVDTTTTNTDMRGTDNAASAAALASLAGRFSGITSLANWLRLLFRADAGDSTARGEVNSGGGTFDETTDSAEAIRGRVDSRASQASVDALNTDSAGTGARSVTVTVTDGTDPIEGARVRLRLGVDASRVLTTNASGVAGPFGVNDGTWTVVIAKSGYSFEPASLVVDGDETPEYEMTAAVIAPAADPDQTTAYLTTLDTQGNPEADVVITFELVDPSPDGDGAGRAWAAGLLNATSDDDGLLQVTLARSCLYRARRGTRGRWTDPFNTGTESTFELPEVLSRPELPA